MKQHGTVSMGNIRLEAWNESKTDETGSVVAIDAAAVVVVGVVSCSVLFDEISFGYDDASGDDGVHYDVWREHSLGWSCY